MSEIDQKFLLTLDARLDETAERVAKIEGRLDAPNASMGKRLSEYGGLVALFLSIIMGTYTVYDKVWLEPGANDVRQRKEIRRSLADLVELTARIAKLSGEGPGSTFAQISALYPQRIALRDSIVEASDRVSGVLSHSDRILLAHEFENSNDIQKGLNQIEHALDTARNTGETANANWTKARMNGRASDLSEMRLIYQLSLDQWKSMGLANTAGSVLQIYIEWISYELNAGACESAVEVHTALRGDYLSPDVYPETRERVQNDFNVMLSRVRQTCGLTL